MVASTGLAIGLLAASTAATVVGAVITTSAQNQVLSQQAKLAEARARQEQLRGTREGNEVRRERIRATAAAIAQGSAGGIDVGSGPTGAIVQEISADAERQLEIVKSNTRIGVLSEQLAARNLRRRRQSAFLPAATAAVGGLSRAITLQSNIS